MRSAAGFARQFSAVQKAKPLDHEGEVPREERAFDVPHLLAVTRVVEAVGGGTKFTAGHRLPEGAEGGFGAAERLEELFLTRTLGPYPCLLGAAHFGDLLHRLGAEFPLPIGSLAHGDAEIILLQQDHLVLGGGFGCGNQCHPEIVEDFPQVDGSQVECDGTFGEQAIIQTISGFLDQLGFVVDAFDAEIESLEQAAWAVLAQQGIRLACGGLDCVGGWRGGRGGGGRHRGGGCRWNRRLGQPPTTQAGP